MLTHQWLSHDVEQDVYNGKMLLQPHLIHHIVNTMIINKQGSVSRVEINLGELRHSKTLRRHTCISCNMGRRDLPDMYAQSPRAQGLRAYISGKS